MFSLSQKVNPHRLKTLAKSYKAIHSKSAGQLSSNTVYNDSEKDGNKNKTGYGEKEIFLFHPLDARTPLPGNTGIPPLTMFYKHVIQKLPERMGDNCDLIFASLQPEGRYTSTLTQAACVSIEADFLASPSLDCVAHECPTLLKKDFLELFPNRDLNDNLTVITFCQKTENDMSQWSEQMEAEREILGKYFVFVAETICIRLKEMGFWADFINPKSGRPQLNRMSTATMLETDMRYRNFGFNIEDLGCCKIISHHVWGTRIYVGAIFTNAPRQNSDVKEVLDRINIKYNSN